MRGLIRSILAVTLLGVLWSFVWFQDDGVSLFVPHVGGWFFAFEGGIDHE